MKIIDRICKKIGKSQVKGRRKGNNMQRIGLTIFQSESLKAIMYKEINLINTCRQIKKQWITIILKKKSKVNMANSTL